MEQGVWEYTGVLTCGVGGIYKMSSASIVSSPT